MSLTRTHVQPDKVTDLRDGFLTREVAPGVFMLSNGNYQSVFFTTSEGVVLFDAPEPLVRFLGPAIAEVTSEPITTLIYSHGHSDHIGGTRLIAEPGTEIIAEERIAEFLVKKKDPRRLIPTRTFSKELTFQKGSRTINLVRDGFHSADGDLLLYLPEEKVLAGIDLLAPGWVPLVDWDGSANMFAYLGAFDRILGYEFDAFISGHTADAARRSDVEITKTYAFDVYETVKRIHGEIDFAELLDQERGNEQAGIKKLIEEVMRRAAAEVLSRWLDGPMKGVDLWAESHCRAMVLYVRWND